MSLIAETKKLRELAQKEPRWIDEKGIAVSVDVGYLNALYTFALAMLEVLGMIREGDAKDLSWVAEFFEADCEPEGDRIAAVIRRYEQMAALMEKEEQ